MLYTDLIVAIRVWGWEHGAWFSGILTHCNSFNTLFTSTTRQKLRQQNCYQVRITNIFNFSLFLN